MRTPGEGNPNAMINGGRVFDVYTPTTDKAKNIAGKVIEKSNTQAERVILNLKHSKAQPADIIKEISDMPEDTRDLVELIIHRGDDFDHYFPY